MAEEEEEGADGARGVNDDRAAVHDASDRAAAAAVATLASLAARSTACEAAVVKLLCLGTDRAGDPPSARGEAEVAWGVTHAEKEAEGTGSGAEGERERVQALLSELICHLPFVWVL